MRLSHLSRSLVLNMMNQWLSTHKVPPTCSDWDREKQEYHFCGSSTIVRLFGKWLLPWKKLYGPFSKRRHRNAKPFISNGYKYIPAYSHPFAIKHGYIAEHRFVLEQKLGRFLKRTEVAHHIDGNKLNNNPNNIELISRKDHLKLHNPLIHRWVTTRY